MRIHLLLLTLLFATAAHAQDEAYKDALRDYLDAAGVMKIYDVAIDKMLDMQQEQSGDPLDDRFWKDVRTEMHQTTNELVEMYAPAYINHFTREDLLGMAEFYRTPLGKKMAAETPQLMQETMQIGAEWGRALGERLGQRMLERQEKDR